VNEAYLAERQDVLDGVHRIVAAGLVAGSSGNLSRRISTPDGDLFAVTASRVPYHRFTIDDVLIVDGDIEPLHGEGIPSSESLCHTAVYAARADVGAVVHTHSVHASAFAVAGLPIPCILDEQVVTLGGAVEVAEYAASASQALADAVVSALGDRGAVLLRHHGVLACGSDVEEACAVAELVERIAQVRALSVALGAPRELPADIVEREQAVYRMLKGMG
jgi:L-fuculose-phosphate aldolase